jgi:hypothetical protein
LVKAFGVLFCPTHSPAIEEVLGFQNLGVHDAGLPPMTDAFDTNQSSWTFNASPALALPSVNDHCGGS